MSKIDKGLAELIISVLVLISISFLTVKLTSGILFDWNGWGVLEPQSYPPCEAPIQYLTIGSSNVKIYDLTFTCSTAWLGMIETIKIAILATFFGMILSLPMGILSSRNLFPTYITYPSRTIVSACRSLPSLIWAIIFVVIVGLGPLAGVLAMTFYTFGYVGKLLYEEM